MAPVLSFFLLLMLMLTSAAAPVSLPASAVGLTPLIGAGLTPREIYADARRATHLLKERLHSCLGTSTGAAGPDMADLVKCIHRFANTSTAITLKSSLEALNQPVPVITPTEPAAVAGGRRKLLAVDIAETDTEGDAADTSGPADDEDDEDDDALAVAATLVSALGAQTGDIAVEAVAFVTADGSDSVFGALNGEAVRGADGKDYDAVRDLTAESVDGVEVVITGEQAAFARQAPQTIDPTVLSDFHASFSALQNIPEDINGISTYDLNSIEFIATIPDGRVEGPAGLVYDTHGNVYYQKGHFFNRRSRSGRPLEMDPLPGMLGATAPVKHFAKLATVIQGYGDMYYHFVAETLPKLAALLPKLKADPELSVLTWGMSYEAAYLRQLGIPESQVVTYDAESVYAADVLVYPTPVPRITPAREALQSARAALGVKTLPAAERTKLVWVSRADEPSRHVANERQILDALGAALPGVDLVYFTKTAPAATPGGGATVVTYGDATLETTQALFESALAVVGPHGAGLAHALFAAPGTPVVELQFMKDPPMMFWHVCAALGLPYWLVPVPQAYWMQASMEAPADAVVASVLRALKLDADAPCVPGFAPGGAASMTSTKNGRSRACATCPAGTYSFNGLRCSPCFAGQVSAQKGAAYCTTCKENTYTSDGLSCVSCEPGRTAWLPGSYDAQQCLLKKEHADMLRSISRTAALKIAGGGLKSRMLAESGSPTAAYQPYVGYVTATGTPSPTQSLYQLAASDPDLSTFKTAVDAAGLASTLQAASANLTVFAPTNEAFASLAASLRITVSQLVNPTIVSTNALLQLLSYHVVATGGYLSDMFYNGEALVTAQGGALTVTVTPMTVYIDNAILSAVDLVATNGVLDVVASVAIPANFVLHGTAIGGVGASAVNATCPAAQFVTDAALAIVAAACVTPTAGCSSCVPALAGALCNAGLDVTSGPNAMIGCYSALLPRLVANAVPVASADPSQCASATTTQAIAAACPQFTASVTPSAGPPTETAASPPPPPSPAAVILPAGCPANLSFASVTPACSAASGAAVCTTCLVAVSGAFCAGGLDVSNQAAAAACITAYLPQLTAAGVPVAAIAGCDTTTAAVALRAANVCQTQNTTTTPALSPPPPAVVRPFVCPAASAIHLAPAASACSAAPAATYCSVCIPALGRAFCAAGLDISSPQAANCLSSGPIVSSLLNSGLQIQQLTTCPGLAGAGLTCNSLGVPLGGNTSPSPSPTATPTPSPAHSGASTRSASFLALIVLWIMLAL